MGIIQDFHFSRMSWARRQCSNHTGFSKIQRGYLILDNIGWLCKADKRCILTPKRLNMEFLVVIEVLLRVSHTKSVIRFNIQENLV